MSHWVPGLKGLKAHCCAMFQPSAVCVHGDDRAILAPVEQT